jgi:hypothetical protein
MLLHASSMSGSLQATFNGKMVLPGAVLSTTWHSSVADTQTMTAASTTCTNHMIWCVIACRVQRQGGASW